MQENLKKQAAIAALPYIKNCRILGIGTGSTVNHFIDQLAPLKAQFEGAVSSSETSTEKLLSLGIPILDLNAVGTLDVYIDGADEINNNLQLVKGGGGALTREKIIAAASRRFICIADQSKLVSRLGSFPLPLEVIPMARSYVAREVIALGGRPVWRENFITDNGNIILDIHGLDILEPMKLENTLNNITGVVTNGLFAKRSADTVLLASEKSTQTLTL
ncbi:MAG: ribose 5-phosphate isomerase A [Cycloclasticus sp.]|nr:ribose 5-phosphate isomerase A [Cycloclasticus sp.]MBG96159.1 ribose 5-phosphate isomerase A [Cycloclasticus sp.]HAI97083.1 ribose 5-phosphate isomerase A [Methylococcaceae bacterium]